MKTLKMLNKLELNIKKNHSRGMQNRWNTRCEQNGDDVEK